MSASRGLGKGLGALIPTASGTLQQLEIERISPGSSQPRKGFDDQSLQELADSIRQVGVLQPVVVRPHGQGFQLVIGERRWRAARRAGLSKIPAIVVETDGRGALLRALVENLQREDLNPMEQAAAFTDLIAEAGLTHEELAERVGLSRPAVSNTLRLLELPVPVQAMVASSEVRAGHARALLGLVGHPLLERVARRVAGEGLSVRETEKLVAETRQRTGPNQTPTTPRAPESAGLEEVAERLADELGTRVRVQAGRNKGRVIIEFADYEDLRRIYRHIVGNREDR